MAAKQNRLPFQYAIRGQQLQYLDGDPESSAIETRDAELEDFLGKLYDTSQSGTPGPPGPAGPAGPAGPSGAQEVFIGPDDPGPSNYEMWYESDTGVLRASVSGAWVAVSTGSGGSVEEVFVGPNDPGGSYELWYDTDAVAGSMASVVSYVHTQGAPASTWTVPHNLGWYPNVTIIDSAGDAVDGDVLYSTTNTLTLKFSGAFSGHAYLS